MRRFRPSLWSTLALLAVGSGLVSLGLWQLDRYREMSATKAQSDAQLAVAPTLARGLNDLQNLSAWRRVRLAGQFSADQGRIINKYIRGELGVWLVAPFNLEDGNTVVVMRGWVPDDEKPWAPPQGPLFVTGLLRHGSGDLGADLGQGQFRSLDPHAILAAYNKRGLGRVLIQGQLVAAGKPFPDGLPRRGFYGFRIRRPHREYAGTWFGLAFALFGLWLYAGQRRGSAKENS